MQSQNQGCGKVVFVLIGVVLLCVGIYLESIMLIAIAVICILLGLAGKKQQAATSSEIRSGTTQNMPVNTTTMNTPVIRSGNLNAYTYHKTAERTDRCPICMEYSGNGYCSKCGFKFNK